MGAIPVCFGPCPGELATLFPMQCSTGSIMAGKAGVAAAMCSWDWAVVQLYKRESLVFSPGTHAEAVWLCVTNPALWGLSAS